MTNQERAKTSEVLEFINGVDTRFPTLSFDFPFLSEMDEGNGVSNESELCSGLWFDSDTDSSERNYPWFIKRTRPWLDKKEWTYTMRRHMQEVVPDVFLGPYNAASRSKLQSLLDHRITHIICVRHATEANFIKPNFPNNFKYLVLEIADTISENVIQHFKKVKIFIDEVLNTGGRVLIHGNAGISRSATLVLAYVMETYEVSQQEALWTVQNKRFCVNPNKGFMTQLKEYEPIYQAEKMLKNGQQSMEVEAQCRKRTIHHIEMDNRSQDKVENTMDS